MKRTFFRFLALALLTIPFQLIAMGDPASYQACVMNAIKSGGDVNGCISILNEVSDTGGGGIESPAGQENNDPDPQDNPVDNSDADPTEDVASGGDEGTGVTINDDEDLEEGDDTEEEEEEEDSDGLVNFNPGSSTFIRGGSNRFCPPKARGTTAAEKAVKPNVLCKCIDGYVVDETRTRCVQKKFGPKPKPVPVNQTPVVPEPVEIDLPNDVPENAWYSDALRTFVAKGLVHDRLPFRPDAFATRIEFLELLWRPVQQSAEPIEHTVFEDVPYEYREVFNHAAEMGWIKGVDNCVGTHPCRAMPDHPLNRAEAAAIINRAFQLQELNLVPVFADAAEGAWYTDSIQVAAAHCILQGDAETGAVRPGDRMNRAEMIVMLSRVTKNLSFPHCGDTLTVTQR